MPIPFPLATPYNDLPLLPPRAEVETKRTLRLAIKARVAVSDLKHAGKLLPNQGMLVKAIALQDAKLSSEIENAVTTNDELYQGFSQGAGETSPVTKEVLRYGEAVWEGFRHLKAGNSITPALFARLATLVNDVETDVRDRPGTRIGNPATGRVIYTPPEGQTLIRSLLENLCEFFNDDRDELDPLIKLAVGHYQFEAIHPFVDGNGRTGRVLNILYLVDRKLLELPILYLSGHLLDTRPDYYRKLRAVAEEEAWEEWVAYLLGAIELTALETCRRIEAIQEAMAEARETLRRDAPKIYSRELVDAIFSQPYTRIAFLEERGLAKRQTASVYLKRLEELGLLRSVKVWRETLYLNKKLMDLLAK